MNIGERIGDYEIVEILGAGGMGQVYKVRNVLSDRVEAMKVLLPNLEGDAGLVDRFLREIKVQATLDHPNIAKLHTALRAQNQLLMVMEFVDGASIEKLLEQGPLGVRDAGAYVCQVLDALAYAHARGVVHRDIKPANIMRTPAGSIKLMDFGIARMQADRRLTQTGHTVGSLFYMSPEQVQGSGPEPRSDLYSTGGTLYEMVTGRRPFQGDSDYSIMAAHLQQTPVAPIEVVPGVPGALNDIILMAIAKDPAARFQSAAAFRAALASVVPDAAHTVTPAPSQAAHTIAPAPPPPPLPPPPSVQAGSAAKAAGSRRVVYMALGSVATLAVLALAVIEGPKFMRARAGGQSVVQETPAPPAQPPPVQVPPTAASEPIPPAQLPPAEQQPVQQRSVTTPLPAAQVTTQKALPRTQPARSLESPPQRQQPPQAAPPQQAPPAQVQQAAPAPPPQQQPTAQMNEFREQYNQIAIRAGTAKAGLRSMEQQMARQGLGLRADVREAEIRMDYLMKEAMGSIRGADAEGAKRNLQMAELALESIEKFVGR